MKREISTLATSFFLVLVFAMILTHRGPKEKERKVRRKGEGRKGSREL